MQSGPRTTKGSVRENEIFIEVGEKLIGIAAQCPRPHILYSISTVDAMVILLCFYTY